MFERLKQKWNVGGWRLFLILVTFAIGGSLCGYAGKKIMSWMGIDSVAVYIPVYIVIITLLWPICVLIISIPFGQYRFFTNYLRKMFRWFGRKVEKKDEKIKASN
jgi:hypothetical protein